MQKKAKIEPLKVQNKKMLEKNKVSTHLDLIFILKQTRHVLIIEFVVE